MSNTRGVQRGKDFEEVIKMACLAVPETTVERLPDPTQGYLGIRNKCDFLMYHYPYVYYIECKTVHQSRLPFSNITFNQWQGMLEVSRNKGVVAGVICWFIPDDKTIFIPIQILEEYKQAGEHSINLNKFWDKRWIEIEGTKKRVFFDYNMANFFKEAERRYIW